MNKLKYFVGIDISSLDFYASIYINPKSIIKTSGVILNSLPGFQVLETWLEKNNIKPQNCILCLEATGVYSELMCYYFTSQGYSIALEPPLKVKRSFPDKQHKTDKIDSKEIAEYAFRYRDELRIWSPKEAILVQIQVLLATREQIVTARTACKNTQKILQRKVVQTPLANKIFKDNIKNFNQQIDCIETEIKKLINTVPKLKTTVENLKTIPGISLLASVNFMVITEGFSNELTENYKKAASYLSICPYAHSSGTSVYKRPRSKRYGPARLRKLLFLASRSVINHNPKYYNYYQQKKAQGKPGKLILNNVANKLLKTMCAISKSQRPYSEQYVSLMPNILAKSS